MRGVDGSGLHVSWCIDLSSHVGSWCVIRAAVVVGLVLLMVLVVIAVVVARGRKQGSADLPGGTTL